MNLTRAELDAILKRNPHIRVAEEMDGRNLVGASDPIVQKRQTLRQRPRVHGKARQTAHGRDHGVFRIEIEVPDDRCDIDGQVATIFDCLRRAARRFQEVDSETIGGSGRSTSGNRGQGDY